MLHTLFKVFSPPPPPPPPPIIHLYKCKALCIGIFYYARSSPYAFAIYSMKALFIYFIKNGANLEVDDCREYLETSKHLASTLLLNQLHKILILVGIFKYKTNHIQLLMYVCI